MTELFAVDERSNSADDRLETARVDTRSALEARDLEVPEADAAEQALAADPTEAPAPRGAVFAPDSRGTAFEANEYDALEQERVVDFDDDYR